MDPTLFALASVPAIAGRSLCAGLPSDVRWRAGALFGLAALLIALPDGANPVTESARPSMLLLVIALAAGLTWRIPARMRTWGMELAEVALLLLAALTAAPLGEAERPLVMLVQGLTVAWALLGVAGGLRGRGFDSHPLTSVILGSAVLVATGMVQAMDPRASGSASIAVVVSGIVAGGLVLESRPAARGLFFLFVRALLGGAAIVAAMWLVGLSIDEHVLLPALTGAMLVGWWYRDPVRQYDSDRFVTSQSDSGNPERETLVVLERLADPRASGTQGMLHSLEHVFPGARMELLRNPAATKKWRDWRERSKLIEKPLLDVVCRQGILRSDTSEELPGRVKTTLRRFGRGVLLFPVAYDSTVYGALLVRGLETNDNNLVQLRRFADLLGHRLEAQHLYSELQHKQRLADLGTFAAALAHDLRSPLATARLEAQLMQRTTSGANQETVDNIVRAIDRVLDDLSETLDFTRTLDLRVEPLNVVALIDDVVASYRAQARDRDVEFVVEHERPGLEVRGDRARLLRVFENLVRNALDVAPGDSTITVQTAEEESGVAITVDDDGPGIEPDLRDRIFEPFVTTKEQGVGLGLAIAHRVITAHRGRIAALAPARGGARMRVWLPLAKQHP